MSNMFRQMSRGYQRGRLQATVESDVRRATKEPSKFEILMRANPGLSYEAFRRLMMGSGWCDANMLELLWQSELRARKTGIY